MASQTADCREWHQIEPKTRRPQVRERRRADYGHRPGHHWPGTPKFVYGLTNSVRYGKWNLNVFLQGVSGVDVLNENLYDLQNGLTTNNKLKYVATESWTGPGTSKPCP